MNEGVTEEDGSRQRRTELKHAYGAAYTMLSDILFSEDPLRINFRDNTDEYEPEVNTILPRLGSSQSVEDVRRIVHEEFVKWFELSMAGPEEKYQVIAERTCAEVVPLLPKQST